MKVFDIKLACILPVIALFILTGCEEGPSHRKADFSPDGKQVALIGENTENDNKLSQISVRPVDKDDSEATVIYTAHENMQVFDVFWKSKRLIMFESGENWSCPEPDVFRKKNKKAPIPKFEIRVSSIPSSVMKFGLLSRKSVFLKETFPCWFEQLVKYKDDNGRRKKKVVYFENIVLHYTNIASARNSDSIIFESFRRNILDKKVGFTLLNTKTGDLKNIFPGRVVLNPTISDDGSRISFLEQAPLKNGETAKNEVLSLTDNEIGKKETAKTVMKVADLNTGAENEVITLTELTDERPVWSKDGKYLFVPGMSNVGYTIECDRAYATAEYAKYLETKKAKEKKKTKAGKETSPDDEKLIGAVNINEAAKAGLCRMVRDLIPNEQRNVRKYVYSDIRFSWYTVHKYYSDMGIAVKLIDGADYFSINPVTEQILVSWMKIPVNDKCGLWLVDYSGRAIKEVKNNYVDKFGSVNGTGLSVSSVSSRGGSVPVIFDAKTVVERPLIGKKQDLLTLACYNFDKGKYDKARDFFEQYTSKYGLPEETGYRLIMIATYRETKDFEKMMKLTKKVPVEELQCYFNVSGKYRQDAE